MNQNLIFAVGFLAQALFSARLLVQWLYSERAGRVLSPLLFWQLSVVASFILMIYGILRHDLAIIAGQSITYCIYIRNLHYQGSWQRFPRPFRLLAWLFPLIALVWIAMGAGYGISTIIFNERISLPLMIWGVAGQIVFTCRFVYQWLCMEKAGKSILPLGFWLISIAGSLMVVSYAIFRRDPVLFVGQIFGFVVYGRNIRIYLRQRRSC
jgi:lipid-A-disaccharide synthase-like uncharacterized protein